jgi:hypothetical protein
VKKKHFPTAYKGSQARPEKNHLPGLLRLVSHLLSQPTFLCTNSFTNHTMSPALDYFTKSQATSATAEAASSPAPTPAPQVLDGPTTVLSVEGGEVYYNARLDPKNYLDGPLSDVAATRLRQMLARPGIVVSMNF